MSSFAHEYPIRILNHGHNSPMMTDRREFPNCVSTILQSLWFFWNTCFPRYYRVHVVVLSFFRRPPFSTILEGSFKAAFLPLKYFHSMSNSKSALFQTNALFTCFAREEGLHQYMNKTKHIHWCDVFPNLVAEYEVLNFCLFVCLRVCL